MVARLILLGALAMLAGSAQASDPRDAVHPGARVRLLYRDTPDHFEHRYVRGLLVGVDNDTVTVSDRAGEPARPIALNSLLSFEVANGRKSAAGKGVWIGILAGAAGGVGASKIICAHGDCSGETDYSGFVTGLFGVGGGLFGAGAGALIGGRFHSERWQSIPLDDLGMGLEPNGDGMKLRLSRTFR